MSVAYLKGLHLQKYKYSLICTCARVCVCTRGGKWSPFKCFSSGTQILFLTELELVEWGKPDSHKAPDLPAAWDGKHKLSFLALLCGLWDSNPGPHTCKASALLTETLYQHLLTYYWAERGHCWACM